MQYNQSQLDRIDRNSRMAAIPGLGAILFLLLLLVPALLFFGIGSFAEGLQFLKEALGF